MVHGSNSIMFTFQPQQLCPSCYSATPLKCSPANPYKTNKSTQVQAHDLHMHTCTCTYTQSWHTHTTQQPPPPPPHPSPTPQTTSAAYQKILKCNYNNKTKEGEKRNTLGLTISLLCFWTEPLQKQWNHLSHECLQQIFIKMTFVSQVIF